ncbi:acyl-CoA dehydrogenase family protein [Amycolatopsis kentuckyensis]|uniref:acyl-CoA dehydrogenase family protein n=1 Tax=Amycolatopsis kentuckyensis TaxID=218823 RepID=UPI003569F89C
MGAVQPSGAELAGRAAELVPLLRANALGHEQNGRLHDRTVDALAEAGIFRMRVPARYGGYECDTSTLVDVGMHLGSGDGATSFTVALWWITSWLVGLFPDAVQEEVFATPDVRVCGTLGPTGTAQPCDGGVLVSGRWAFNSGAAHSRWKLLAAISMTAEGPAPIMALVPIDQVELLDDWHTSALQGTGSVTAVAEDVFVPHERVLAMGPVLQQQYASVHNRDLPMFRVPLIAAVTASSVGKVVGLAKAAHEDFCRRSSERGITYTDYTSQREAPLTHLQVAESALRIDEAEFHARRLASTVDEKGLLNAPWKLEERARVRVTMGRVCQLATDAVDTLSLASGGSSIHRAVPIQRIQRDLHAIGVHALNNPQVNLELYGRVLCGLEPNSPYV